MRLELTERDIWLLKITFSVLAVFLLNRKQSQIYGRACQKFVNLAIFQLSVVRL